MSPEGPPTRSPSHPPCYQGLMSSLSRYLPGRPQTISLEYFPPSQSHLLCFLAVLELKVFVPAHPPSWCPLWLLCLIWTPGGVRWGEGTVRNQRWQSCLSCSCLMFLCLFCVWAHGSVSVCVCHVLHLYHLPVSPGHAPLFSPCLVLVCFIVFTWSSCALLLYIVFLPLVSLLVRFGVYLFHGLRVKLWSCASYFDLAEVIFWSLILLYYILVFSSSCFLILWIFI